MNRITLALVALVIVLTGLLAAQQTRVGASQQLQPKPTPTSTPAKATPTRTPVKATSTPVKATSTPAKPTPTSIFKKVQAAPPTPTRTSTATPTNTPTVTPTKTATPTRTPTGTPTPIIPVKAKNFSIEISGILQDNNGREVVRISGIKSESDLIVLPLSTDGRTRYSPGKLKQSLMVLEVIPFTNAAESLRQWRKNIVDGLFDKRSMSIIFQNDAGQEVWRYNFYEVWPVSWSMGTLDSTGSGTILETFELAFELWERA